MTRRTLPDSNQPEIIQALEACRFVVFDMHNVPKATGSKELAGLPDLMAIQPEGLTLVGDFDRRQVIERIADISGLVILKGAIITPEVKSDKGKLRQDQADWWGRLGLKPLVFRTFRQVLEFFSRDYEVRR